MAGSPLYSTEVLALAVELANYPLVDDLDTRAAMRSPICGSSLEIGLRVSADGRIAAAGAHLAACAIGQAAAAICLAELVGRGCNQVDLALCEIDAWLTRDGALPGWPRFAALAPARAYPARHGAILLPWRAAQAALSKAGPRG